MTDASAQRAQAAAMLHAVLAERRTTDQVMSADASPLVRELLFGSLRHYFSLAHGVDTSLHRPLKPKDQILRSLLIVGAYQLSFMRVADHAAIFETVAACDELGKPWARGLVNAVLRRCASGRDSAERSFEHPGWLDAALRRDYADAEAIMTANNERAPMCLRINLSRTTPDRYLAMLATAGTGSRRPGARDGRDPELGLGPETRVLDHPCRTDSLPGHAAGLVSVQDAGAQFAASLLAPLPGERVLDACAAPGGKLFHLLERCPGVEVTALEQNRDRLDRIGLEATRLGHDGFTALQADATTLDWWNGTPFRRVLLDAPCSGTGTLRRHPDIKILRRLEDVEEMAALQERLLSNLWRVLEPGGTLLYCTCSILAAENDAVISSFLAHHPDALPSALRLASGRATRHGWQLLPTEADTDGFYYARMTRASA